MLDPGSKFLRLFSFVGEEFPHTFTQLTRTLTRQTWLGRPTANFQPKKPHTPFRFFVNLFTKLFQGSLPSEDQFQ